MLHHNEYKRLNLSNQIFGTAKSRSPSWATWVYWEASISICIALSHTWAHRVCLITTQLSLASWHLLKERQPGRVKLNMYNTSIIIIIIIIIIINKND